MVQKMVHKSTVVPFVILPENQLNTSLPCHPKETFFPHYSTVPFKFPEVEPHFLFCEIVGSNKTLSFFQILETSYLIKV